MAVAMGSTLRLAAPSPLTTEMVTVSPSSVHASSTRVFSCAKASSSSSGSSSLAFSASCSSSKASSLCGTSLRAAVCAARRGASERKRNSGLHVRGYKGTSENVGEDPDWFEEDYVALGLAHCFQKDANQKLVDAFVVEPIPAGGLECMENGGVTCYVHATGSTLGVALKQDLSILPKEFAGARFCDDFSFRAKCASRSWKRQHAVTFLMDLVPKDGTVRSDWNFSLEDKRVLNQEHIVNDSDNIKQDMSIDVYGRTDKTEEMTTEIGQLYNV